MCLCVLVFVVVFTYRVSTIVMNQENKVKQGKGGRGRGRESLPQHLQAPTVDEFKKFECYEKDMPSETRAGAMLKNDLESCKISDNSRALRIKGGNDEPNAIPINPGKMGLISTCNESTSMRSKIKHRCKRYSIQYC